MSWIATIFSMAAAMCLTLAGMHLLVWLRDRRALPHLLFSIGAVAAASAGALYLMMLRSQSPAQYGELLRWIQLPLCVLVVALAWFLRLYVGAGRDWLLWLVCGLRILALILSFLLSPNLNFREITGLRHLSLLGETVSYPVGVANPWGLVGQGSLVLFFIYVLDTTAMGRRKNPSWRSSVLGGAMAFGLLVALVGIVSAVWFGLPLFGLAAAGFVMVTSMASYGLSGDLLRTVQLNAQLRVSQERNRAILAAIPDLMFVMDKDGVYLDYHAPKPEDLLLPPENFLGRKVRDIMPGQLAETFSRSFEVALRTGEVQVVDYTIPLQGKNRFFEAHIVRKGVDQLLSVVRDVTKRKQAEESLRNIAAGVSAKTGETFFHSLAEHLGKVLEVDYAYICETLDQGRRARTLAMYAHGGHTENVEYPLEGSPCEQVLKLGLAAFPQGVKALFPDDHLLQQMDVQGYLGVRLQNSTGQPDGLMAVMSRQPLADLENARVILSIFAARASAELERSQVQKELQRSEERYRDVVESQTEMVFRCLTDTTLTFVNGAYCRFFGLPSEQLIGRKFIELIPTEDRAPVLEHVAAVAGGLNPAPFEAERRSSNGTVTWNQWVTHVVAGANGQAQELQAVGRDITDRKRAEETMQNLAHASRLAAVGELTALIAHELNQPLCAILSNAEAAEDLLGKKEPPLKLLREIITDIRKDDLRASESIERIGALLSRRPVEMHPIDLNEIIADTLRLARGDALRRRVRIHHNFSESLPRVQGDRVHLQHVLLNLVLNGMDAVHDNPESERHLFISTACNDEGAVEVAVKDLGHGISTENLQQIFYSFFTTKRNGMGLGLAIARSIIEHHSGDIWAQNNPGEKGATFRFTLPANHL